MQRKRLRDPKTRARLLAAARQAFAKKGYANAGTRDIATIAGVSSTLMFRYFSSKAELFEAMLVEFAPLENILSGVRRDRFGAHLARYILKFNVDALFASTFALAVGQPQARKVATRFASRHVLPPLADWLGPPNAKVRALQIIMVAAGFQIYGRQLPLLPSATGVNTPLAKWFANTVQSIVDQS